MATAFAVFCETDNSLTFYKRDTVPTAGSTFEGKAVTSVYTGFETDTSESVPWDDYNKNITSVTFADEISPISTAYWFSDFNYVTTFNNLSKLNTSNVESMRAMFQNCGLLPTLDLSHFDTSNVTDMSFMFFNMRAVTNLDLSGFDTSNVTNMMWMFNYCESLTTIYVSGGWSMVSITSNFDMFDMNEKLIGGNGTEFSTDHVDTTYARIDKPGEPGYFTYKKYYSPETRKEYLIQGTTWYDIAESVRGLVNSKELMNPNKVIKTISNIGHAEEVSF